MVFWVHIPGNGLHGSHFFYKSRIHQAQMPVYVKFMRVFFVPLKAVVYVMLV